MDARLKDNKYKYLYIFLNYRVWPRTSAVAEKLWSAESSRYVRFPRKEVYHRIEEHTCRMNRRGVAAQPPNGPGFCVAG